MFYYIEFNVKLLINYYQQKFNIYDCFDCFNRKNMAIKDKNSSIKCEECNNYTEFNEFKQFYNLPKNLIIFFDRGENCEYNNYIDFEEELIINRNYVESLYNSNECHIYDLLAIICRNKDENNKNYLSFTKWNDNINCFVCDFDYSKKYNLNEIKKKGDIIGLFYYFSNAKSNF